MVTLRGFAGPHDTAANWTADNPVLSKGVFASEEDTGLFKIGDGVTAWNSLAYAGAGSVTNPSGSALLSGGGVVWTGGLGFTVSAAVYLIAGTEYTSAQTNLTLTTADATDDRIDIIALDDTNSAIVIDGTPAPVPAAPDVDPASQLELTFVYVAALATTPTNVTSQDIYLENTEYTSSTTAPGRINLASTSNPFAGTTDIEATAAINGDQITLVKPSGTLALGSYTSLILNIRSKAAWAKSKSLSVSWLNGATLVGAAVGIKTGAYGFDSSVTGVYQQVTIPISAFGTGTVDRLRISVAGGGSSIGFYLDNIVLQGGTASGGGSTGTLFAVEEDGVAVVPAALGLNAEHGLDVFDRGNGVAGLAVDETELTGSLIPGIPVAATDPGDIAGAATAAELKINALMAAMRAAGLLV